MLHLDVEKDATQVILRSGMGQLAIQPCSSRFFRIRYTKRECFSGRESLMLIGCPPCFSEWEMRETERAVIISTDSLQLEIDRDTWAFTWRDSVGELLVREPERGGKTLNEIDVMKAKFDSTATIETVKSVDGDRARATEYSTYVDRQAYQWKLEFEFSPGEALYGLGQHEEGVLNRRGTQEYLYQANMKVALPMLLSTRGWAIVADCYSLMTFHDDSYGSYLWADVAEEMEFYFMYGPEFDGIIETFRDLTGQAPMLPLWAFGYAQSKERYVSQQDLLSTAREFRRRHIPLDLIIQDWQYWPENFWGEKSFDSTRFPDPAGLTEALHEINTRLMISIWPLMRGDGPNQRELAARGFLLGDQSAYDVFNPAARAIYWKQANDGLFKYGIDAWWCDATEPFGPDWNGAAKLEPWQRMNLNMGDFKLYLDPACVNAYSLLHADMIYHGQRGVREDKRVVNLIRSCYSGQQRYSTITWSGDIAAKWETLRAQIPEGLNFCACGIPYWTLDIGAFFVKTDPTMWFWNGDYDQGCEDEGYRELYVRWFQYGAFLPMFRSHGTDTPREPWRFGEPGSATYDTLLKFLHLRYRLLPYIYSLGAKVTRESYTPMRLLAFDFRDDACVYDIDDEYMFGPAFLVCPVTEPMYFGPNSTPLDDTEKTREVYLPAGCDWYDFWTGQRYSGGQDIEADAPLEIMPLYVKSGSIIPLAPRMESSDELRGAPIELRIYPGADGEFTLYNDEYDNYNYEKGNFSTITLRWDDAAQTLTIGAREGSYPGMPESITFNVAIIREGIGGVEQPAEFAANITYRGNELCWR